MFFPDPPPWVAPPPRRAVRPAAVVVPVILAVLLLAAEVFGFAQFLRKGAQPPDPAAQWQPYVDAGKTFAQDMTTVNPQSVDSDIQRIIDESTAPFRDDFASKRAEYKQTILTSSVTTQGTVTGAALESIHARTADVLVATTTKIANTAGASQDPRNWRLHLTVVKLGDGYKVSIVEFVP